MDFQNILKASKDFYKFHRLATWAKALPNSIKLSKEAELLLGVGGGFRRQAKLQCGVLWPARRAHVRLQNRQRQQTARRECDSSGAVIAAAFLIRINNNKEPLWYQITNLVVIVAAVLLGGYFRTRKVKAQTGLSAAA